MSSNGAPRLLRVLLMAEGGEGITMEYFLRLRRIRRMVPAEACWAWFVSRIRERTADISQVAVVNLLRVVA